MKKLVLLFLILIGQAAMAQKVNKVSLSEINPVYIEVSVLPISKFKKKVHATIDYGQKVKKHFGTKYLYLTDNEDKPIEFQSKLAVFNYLNSLGYTYVKSYSNSKVTSSEVHLFEKAKK
ncbi:MAG: hypothetical protein LBE34_11675 [Flavobacteriaceae bacterium]|jgi:hypothetical protein|nr:hypothetical protein [Flavobacteriaceae bacterium]